MGPLGRLRDALVLGGAGLGTKGLERPLNRIRVEYGLAPVADLFEHLDYLQLVLVLSGAGFDFPTRLPPNVRYVGPQLVDPDWAVGSVDWRPEGPGPLVLVAMSSLYQRQADLLGTVASALGSLPVRAVITTGRAVRPDMVPAPGNVRVVQGAPHHDVLREASVVVTHAGAGDRPQGPGGRCGLRVHSDGPRPAREHDPGAAAGRRRPGWAAVADEWRRGRHPARARRARVRHQRPARGADDRHRAATHPTAADEVEATAGITPGHDT